MNFYCFNTFWKNKRPVAYCDTQTQIWVSPNFPSPDTLKNLVFIDQWITYRYKQQYLLEEIKQNGGHPSFLQMSIMLSQVEVYSPITVNDECNGNNGVADNNYVIDIRKTMISTSTACMNIDVKSKMANVKEQW